MRSILIAGASGMVGHAFCREALTKEWNVVALGREDRHRLPGVLFAAGDVRDHDYLRTVFLKTKPHIVVNLAANTDHRQCEEHPEDAWALHVEGAARIAALSRSGNARHIHISSEAVYGNLGDGPRVETDICKPDGVYATTKRAGEIAVLDSNAESLVLRCTPVGCAPGEQRSLVGWMLGQFRHGNPIAGFDDWIFSPVETAGLARMLLGNYERLPAGIYNWGVSTPVSKLAFAEQLSAELGYPQRMVHHGSRFNDGSRLDTSLDSLALATHLDIRPPDPRDIFTGLAKAACLLSK